MRAGLHVLHSRVPLWDNAVTVNRAWGPRRAQKGTWERERKDGKQRRKIVSYQVICIMNSQPR